MWPPYWIRHFLFLKSDFRIEQEFSSQLQQKNSEFTQILYARSPYWIRHVEFWDYDFRFVIYNPKNFGNYRLYFTHSQEINAFW